MTRHDGGEGEVLYAPLPRRHSREGRRSFGGLLCRIACCAALVVVFWLTYKLGQGILAFKEYLDFGHHDIIHREPKDGARVDDVTLVRPLLRANDSFAIRATVWLDVTQHLEQGNTLPTHTNGKPLQLVSYLPDAEQNRTRTEVVVFSDTVMNLTTWHAKQFTTLPLQIPIDPLYTQDLGPSTLRLTTHVEYPKEKEEALGTFSKCETIFGRSAAFLPRSPDSVRIRHGHERVGNQQHLYAESLHDVLELNGASTSLLAMFSSDKKLAKCPEGGANLVTDYTHQGVSPFLDNVFRARNFTSRTLFDQKGQRLALGSPNCTVYVPHILSRSSVSLIVSEHDMELSQYRLRQSKIKSDSEWQSCFDVHSKSPPSSCRALRKHLGLETMAVFLDNSTEQGEVASYRYGPTLVQQLSDTAAQDHFTVPRRRPSKDDHGKVETKKDRKKREECLLPILQPDDTDEFFAIDLRLQFGSLKGFRASLVEQFHTYSSMNSTVIESEDELDSIRIYTNSVSHFFSTFKGTLIGDRLDASHHPWLQISASVLSGLIDIAVMLLTLLYWYTRTTTAGLCLWAQWAGVANNILGMGLASRKPSISSLSFTSVVAYGPVIVTFLLKICVLARLELILPTDKQSWLATRLTRRPRTKAEGRCAVAEKSMLTWQMVALSLLLMALYEYLADPQARIVRQGQGCYENGDPVGQKSFWRSALLLFNTCLWQASNVGQMLFNVRSPAIRPKGGSFAGSFKITAGLLFFGRLLSDLIVQVDRIGGTVDQRVPVTLATVEQRLLRGWQVVQAIQYPGIPAKVDEEAEEDL